MLKLRRVRDIFFCPSVMVLLVVMVERDEQNILKSGRPLDVRKYTP
jgi:hypothetical protein